jgi:hypothetical protein
MMSSTSEGTAQIGAASVAPVREKTDAAMHTMSHATLELRLCLQQAVQGDLIVPDERLGAIVLMPIGPEGKNFLDGYNKKARFSVMI